MSLQRLGGGIVARQLRFGQAGVDFLVANVMKQNRFAAFATAQLGNKVMAALRNVWWDRAATQRAQGHLVSHSYPLFYDLSSATGVPPESTRAKG